MGIRCFIIILSFFIFDSHNFAERVELSEGDFVELDNTPLNADQGYLILEIDPQFSIGKIELTRIGSFAPVYSIRDLNKKTVHIIKLPEGKYFFSRVKSNFGRHARLDKKHYYLEVKKNKINYPGELVFKLAGGINRFDLRLKNRVFRFKELYSKILHEYYRGYRLVYSGSYVDTYTEEVSACCE